MKVDIDLAILIQFIRLSGRENMMPACYAHKYYVSLVIYNNKVLFFSSVVGKTQFS